VVIVSADQKLQRRELYSSTNISGVDFENINSLGPGSGGDGIAVENLNLLGQGQDFESDRDPSEDGNVVDSDVDDTPVIRQEDQWNPRGVTVRKETTVSTNGSRANSVIEDIEDNDDITITDEDTPKETEKLDLTEKIAD